jgi:hypothetical protein
VTTRTITYFIVCPHCNNDASSTTLDVTQPNNESIRIDVELSVGQLDVTCEGCGCVFSIELIIEPYRVECPRDQDDDEDTDEDTDEDEDDET